MTESISPKNFSGTPIKIITSGRIVGGRSAAVIGGGVGRLESGSQQAILSHGHSTGHGAQAAGARARPDHCAPGELDAGARCGGLSRTLQGTCCGHLVS